MVDDQRQAAKPREIDAGPLGIYPELIQFVDSVKPLHILHVHIPKPQPDRFHPCMVEEIEILIEEAEMRRAEQSAEVSLVVARHAFLDAPTLNAHCPRSPEPSLGIPLIESTWFALDAHPRRSGNTQPRGADDASQPATCRQIPGALRS